MNHRGKIVRLPPNRVWRTYPGGRTLDRLAGAASPVDSHFPEDWLASTTRAVNAGREHVTEGPSAVRIGGETTSFPDLLARDPEYFLGAAHVARFGVDPQILVKLLDPATRLHFQVHPTSDFARQFLGSASGKSEAYHVLATRPEVADPCIYLGFARPPSRAELRRMIEQQDIAGIEACFDPIRVAPGDTYIVPGGVPHALGAGVFLVELQEPSDLVVRFEFERAGYVLPEPARFMGRGLEFCLEVFDLTPWPRSRVAVEAACPPLRRRPLGPDSWQDDLIGPNRTACFRMRQSQINGLVTKTEDSCYVGVVTEGACAIEAGGEHLRVERYNCFFCPAGIGPVTISPSPNARLLECYPPAP